MVSDTRKEIVALYLPVIHAGYLDLLGRHEEADIGVLGSDIIQTFPYLRKEIRALTPEQAILLLRGNGRTAVVLSEPDLPGLNKTYETVVMPSDDISRELAPRIGNVEYEPVFLRWDRDNTQLNQEVKPDRSIAQDDVEAGPIIAALMEASQNSTWWRHVGAAVVKDDGIILRANNHTLPTEYTNWIDGDPRNTTRRGEGMELYNEIHAEAALIAKAAKSGISLYGLALYVTVFPCPNCAKLIATSGISRCYFAEGYAMLNGHEIMRNAGVELIKIDGMLSEEDERSLRPYPKG